MVWEIPSVPIPTLSDYSPSAPTRMPVSQRPAARPRAAPPPRAGGRKRPSDLGGGPPSAPTRMPVSKPMALEANGTRGRGPREEICVAAVGRGLSPLPAGQGVESRVKSQGAPRGQRQGPQPTTDHRQIEKGFLHCGGRVPRNPSARCKGSLPGKGSSAQGGFAGTVTDARRTALRR
jgi:hypothetical protein